MSKLRAAQPKMKSSLVVFFLHKQSPKQALMQVWLFADVYNPFYLRLGFVSEPAASRHRDECRRREA